jgi:putative ABC transport system substrate-binding protein
MRRREFISLLGGAAAATWPLAARAQQTGQMRRVGIIFGGYGANDPELQARVGALKEGLRDLGWAEGRNIRFDLRIGGGDTDRIAAHAAELIHLTPDLIVSNSVAALRVLSRQTRTIPIVFVNVVEPVRDGFVSNLAKPGGNITGFASFEPSMGGKWLELLKMIAPSMTRVAAVRGSNDSAVLLPVIESAGRSLGVQVATAVVQDAADFERAIDSFAREPGGGLIILPGTIITANRDVIIKAIAQHKLPAIYGFRYMAAAGGLMSYGIDGVDLFRRAAPYVDRILRGANPGDLPVQLPTKFQFVINLQTAKALGLEIPPMLLALTDEAIE